MIKQPVAYIRKSKVTSDRHVSWDVQEREVRALAARHGDNGERLVLLSDWSKSGRAGKTHLRADYMRLKSMISEGKVSALYGYSLSRLGRSVSELSNLFDVCAERKVPVRLVVDSIDTSTASGRMMANILSSVAQFEAEVAGERIADALRVRRDRGDVLGLPPYGYRLVNGRLEPNPDEPLQPIIDAYRATGSAFAVARALNEAGLRTRRGRLWSSKVIGDVLRREGLTTRRRPRPGAKAEADWITYQLLRCHCGNTMTPMDRRSPRVTCWRSRHDPEHSRPFGIAESKLLPAIRAEADRFDPDVDILQDEQDSERLQAIGARRERVIDLFVNGIIDKADRDRRLSALDAEAEIVETTTRLRAVPQRIDWDRWSAREINNVLRVYFDRIELGPDLMPTRFVWRLPAEYLT